MHFRNKKKSALDTYFNDPIDTDGDGNSLTLMDIMAEEDSIIDCIDLHLKSEQLHKYMQDSLEPREREILLMRYGLGGVRPLTQRECAQKLNISRSYVSRPAYCKQCLKKPVFMRVCGHCFFRVLPQGSAALIVSIGKIDKNKGGHSSIMPKRAFKQDKPGFLAFLPEIDYT